MTQIIINETTPIIVEVSTPGPQGSSGTASVGTVTTGASGSAAAVTNSGTPSAAVFNFTIPKGDIGDVTPAATAAKNAAEAAAVAAAASELAAETAQESADDFAASALASAIQASASASTASTKAQEATTSANNASNSAQSVLAAANTATTKAQEAATSASNALASANTASTKAQEASASEVISTTKAQEAVVSASTATNAASSASTSAASALSAQQVTTDNATLAIAQANIASTKATQAAESEAEALVQASVATAQANISTAQAVIATAQADISTTQAAAALASAQASAASASTSSTQAGISTTQASAASSSASNAALSAVAAAASQVLAAGSATAANTSAGNASGSAANALAIYATASAQQAALSNAQAAASVAQGYAASAASVAQQDLSGVTSAALHRSPNAVTAMFLYDTSKDSDGGAWTEKCQSTSWYNEAVTGKWLGAHAAELYARNAVGAYGSDLVTNGTFSSDTTWGKGTGVTISDGVAHFVNVAANQDSLYQGCLDNSGTKAWLITFTIKNYVAGGVRPHTGASSSTEVFAGNGTYTALVGGNANPNLIFKASVAGTTLDIDDVKAQLVTPITATGDYFQLTTDGKFYKLNPTSGITETFRGNKRKFPKLAGIVAEAASVTIYDLTEPGRPMWMRFKGGGGTNSEILSWAVSSSVSCLSALNGRIEVGSNNANGLVELSFAKDDLKLGSGAGAFAIRASRFVSNRNNINAYATATDAYVIASSTVNAVAMTVLPDAPVDPVTGLKVPTIAVATAGGVSVIKHNGTVVNSASTGAYNTIALTPSALHTNAPGGSNIWNIAAPLSTLGASFALSGTLMQGQFASPDQATIKTVVPSRSKLFRMESNTSRMKIGNLNETGAFKSTAVSLSNTFNTGHLVGDIRRAYLADVDVGSVSGTELVSNPGNPFVNTTGWAGNQATLSVVDGRIRVTATLGAGQFMSGYVNLTGLQPGEPYVVSGRYIAGTVTSAISGSYLTGPGSNNGSSILLSAGVTGSYTQIADADGSVWFSINSSSVGVGSYFDIEFLSVKRVVADRSYKGQLASITGTLTKSQVASAAQLVAYSGFSASNYLREPYSADLDFGTGEWSVGAWVNVPAVMSASSFPSRSADLAVNGTFDTDTAWLKGAGWSISGGAAIATGSGNHLYQSPAGMATGKIYEVTYTLTVVSGGVKLFTGGPSTYGVERTTSGTYTDYVVVGSVVNNLGFTASQSAAFTGSIDNVVIKEVTGVSCIVDRAHSSGAKINLGITPQGFLTATAFDGTTTRTVTTTAAYNTATWLKAEAQYKTDGSLGIVVNGQEVAVTRGTPLLTLNNSNAVLTIGNSFALDAPFPGSIALLKASATVPTAEQMVWMYEQEKQMFRDGAQVTLPDSGSIVDLTYDDLTDKWMAVSATNESEWSGLVRTSVTAAPAGSYSKVTAASGVQLQARTSTNPGVDITIPAANLREELLKDAEAANKLNAQLAIFDYVGGFTANTTSGTTSIASAAGITYPVSYIGARVTGTGIPTDTFILGISGTTLYLSKAATATGTAVQLSFTDFILPVGYEAKVVLSAGLVKTEGTTKDYVRLFDGFKETIRFGTAPGYNTAVQIQATRSIQ